MVSSLPTCDEVNNYACNEQDFFNVSLQEQCLKHMKNQQWKLVRMNISSPKFSEEVSKCLMTSPGTLLHVACSMQSVPRDIFLAILQLCSHACRMEDEDGNLPIHLVCATSTMANQSDPDLIKLMLETCPETSFLPSYEEQELPFYTLINHHIQNMGLQAALHLISLLPSSTICNEHTSVLHQIGNEVLPEAICEKIIEEYPNICKIHNDGNTLLHIMCSHEKSTASFIWRIISIFPEACAIRDENGNLPLHLVNSQLHSLEIIRLLMHHYPQALHLPNFSGQIPLVSPLIRTSSRRVKELLRYHATEENNTNSLLHSKNHFGMVPVHDYFFELQKQLTNLISQGTISISDLCSYGSTRRYTKYVANELESFFYLMRVAVYSNVQYDLSTPHKASFWCAFPIFTKVLLHHSPELACHKDCKGNLPLHVIAKQSCKQLHSVQCSSCNHNITGPYFWHPCGTNICRTCHNTRASMSDYDTLIEYQGNEIIRDCLAVNPSAASVHDAQGNLPLHLSLKSGKYWSTGIRELIDAAPSTLGAIDEETGIFPFMLAAEAKESDESLNAGQKLTTIFELLKRGPSYIQ